MTETPGEMNNLKLFSIARSIAKKCYYITRTQDTKRQKELFTKAKTESDYWPYDSIEGVESVVLKTVGEKLTKQGNPISFEQKTEQNQDLIYSIKDKLLSDPHSQTSVNNEIEGDQEESIDEEQKGKKKTSQGENTLPSVDELRSEILDGTPATKLSDEYSYSTYKIKKLVKGEATCPADESDIPPLKYNTEKQQWEKTSEDASATTTTEDPPTSESKNSSVENNTTANTTPSSSNNQDQSETTPQTKKQPTETTNTNDIPQAKRDRLKKLYGQSVVSIAEKLYDCFIKYDSKYTDISNEHPDIEFPLRQKALESVSNTSGKTKFTRVKKIANWVDKWYDNEDEIIDMNSKTPKPMGMN